MTPEQKAAKEKYNKSPKGKAANRRYNKSAKHKASALRCEQRRRSENPERDRERNLKRKYGLSLADYAAMFEAQKGLCAVCKSPSSELLHVDHDHRTGEVRGLLCRTCNLGIGFLKDDKLIVESVLKYL